MEDPLRDDTLRAYFAMYDYGSHAKCLTECMNSKPRYRYFCEGNEVCKVCCLLPRLEVHKAENSVESAPRFHCLFIRDF